MVENTMRVMVGLARGPNEELTVAMLPLRDLGIKCNIKIKSIFSFAQMSIKEYPTIQYIKQLNSSKSSIKRVGTSVFHL